MHPSWEWWPLLHQTVQKCTLDINHFRSIKFGIWMCFVLLFSCITLLHQQVMVVCRDNVPLPKYCIYIWANMWQSRIEINCFLCILITVPHPKHYFCSFKVSGKHVVIGEVFRHWLLWYMLLCWKHWFSCKWEYGSQDGKHSKVSASSLLFYTAKWEGPDHCFSVIETHS